MDNDGLQHVLLKKKNDILKIQTSKKNTVFV